MSTRALFIGILIILAAGTATWLLVRPGLPVLSESPGATSDTLAGPPIREQPDTMIMDGGYARPLELPPTANVLEVGDVAPEFTLESLDGGTFKLADHLGEVVVLNFWATWCEPCHEEMPDLQLAHEALASEGVSFAGVSLDEEGRAAVRDFHDAYPVEFPLLVGGLDVAREYGAHYAVPTTYVVGRDGLIADRIVGAVDVESFIPRLRSLVH